jgi:predicted DNA-binding protein (MmcQ/YjbR family)
MAWADRVFEAVKEKCEIKPNITFDHPWEDHTAWKLGGKIFCVGAEGSHKISVKSTHDKQTALIQHPAITVADYVGRYGWVSIDIDSEDTLAIALDLIDESYDLVAAKLPKRFRT